MPAIYTAPMTNHTQIQGVKQIHAHPLVNSHLVLIKPPTLDSLRARLEKRATETPESLAARLARAKTDLEFAETEKVFDKIVVNDNVDRAYGELHDHVVSLYQLGDKH